MMPWLQPAGTIDVTSFYDTSDLKHTLEHLVGPAVSIKNDPSLRQGPLALSRNLIHGKDKPARTLEPVRR
jgi:hypothetical protein